MYLLGLGRKLGWEKEAIGSNVSNRFHAKRIKMYNDLKWLDPEGYFSLTLCTPK